MQTKHFRICLQKSPRMTHKLQILISDVESAVEDFTNSDEIVRNNATAEKVEAASILEGLKETIG